MRKSILVAASLRAALGISLGLGYAAVASAEDLLVYTAIEADQLQAYKEAFEKDHPDVTINWVRDSTGIVTAKLLAEKGNPQADVVWGLAATSLKLLDSEGVLMPYAPAGLDRINPKFRDPRDEPTWVGMDVWWRRRVPDRHLVRVPRREYQG